LNWIRKLFCVREGEVEAVLPVKSKANAGTLPQLCSVSLCEGSDDGEERGKQRWFLEGESYKTGRNGHDESIHVETSGETSSYSRERRRRKKTKKTSTLAV
jgi:hypothetical protein